ncbi:FAD-dependent oxidoreductase [Leptolyngbya sp. AN03gr2]|uniref:FAD-dependent oxidoreductase n=1 Tax=unclassified Leptolyngbya TaxID=2650499 RepID=UPI003D312432
MKQLVLVGGGHSHAVALLHFVFALRQLGLSPLSDVQITLISEAEDTAYSGMLPGYVAGFYSYEECHINLRSLCEFAKARLIVDRAIGLEQNRVICEQNTIEFDVVSIDIGSTPTIPAGAKGIGAKPISRFLNWWNDFAQSNPKQLAIVGGGTGGVELALNMQHRLPETEIHLFQRDRELMPKHNVWVRRQFKQLLIQRGIQLHFGEAMTTDFKPSQIVWVTHASAPNWIRESGLKTDDPGFILVNDALQSVSHSQVFAAGDIATMVNYDRPKAGVFAVRQGKPLFENLRAALNGQALKAYYPQSTYLSLIGTGDRSAVASYGKFGLPRSRLLWWMKDFIDRAFMNQFRNLG